MGRKFGERGPPHASGEPIERASYFLGESLSARKMWERGSGEAFAMPEGVNDMLENVARQCGLAD